MSPQHPVLFNYIVRGYPHFDPVVSATAAERLATNPESVAKHAFYPFVRRNVLTQKIKKKKGGGVELKKPKHRPILYAAHRDSHIFTHYGEILVEYYEPTLVERGLGATVTAFRSLEKKRNIHFANEAFEFIRRQGNCSVAVTDISDYFGSINHTKLKAALCRLLGVKKLPNDHFAVYRAITQFCEVEEAALYKALGIDPRNPHAGGRKRLCMPNDFRTKIRGKRFCKINWSGKGIPQGSPISAILSNIYLLDFDTVVNTLVAAHGGLYRRYCDDLLVVLPTPELRDTVLDTMREMLKDLRLEAHPEKTAKAEFTKSGDKVAASKAMNYLGFTFDGENKRIRPGSIAKYYFKMRRGVGRTRAIRFRAHQKNPSQPWEPLRRRKLHILYSYLGRHNFLSYAFDAARIMNDAGIKTQVKAHWKKLQTLIMRKTP